LQLAGVAVVAVGIALASSIITPLLMIAGSGVWLFGFTYRRRANRSRKFTTARGFEVLPPK
jgi:hypothetical protein